MKLSVRSELKKVVNQFLYQLLKRKVDSQYFVVKKQVLTRLQNCSLCEAENQKTNPSSDNSCKKLVDL